jgi:predicted Zn finger-like uncharacterized protein
MILTCPNCSTQYVVKDGAIPPEGRQVRCAACKHSWHQDPEAADVPEQESAADSVPAGEPVATIVDQSEEAAAEDESLAESTLIDPRSGPEAEERAYEEAVLEGDADGPAVEAASSEPSVSSEPATTVERATTREDWNEPPHAEAAADTFSPFAVEDETESHRRSPLITILIVALVVIALAAAFWFFAPPDLKARLGLVASATPLQLVTTHMDRQPLESGNELLTVTGRIINPSGKEQAVPPIQAELKNHSGRVVHRWTIQPPSPSLAAGASASFNSAEVNVPPGSEELTLTLGEPKT